MPSKKELEQLRKEQERFQAKYVPPIIEEENNTIPENNDTLPEYTFDETISGGFEESGGPEDSWRLEDSILLKHSVETLEERVAELERTILRAQDFNANGTIKPEKKFKFPRPTSGEFYRKP
jgi:hypothetical protein